MVDSSTPTKVCTKCQQEQPRDQFRRNARYRDGSVNWCKSCERAYKSEWTARNIDKERERHRQVRESDPEKAREKVRRSYQKHRAERLAYDKQHHKENRASYRENARKWRIAQPFKHRQYDARGRARKLGVALDDVDYQAIYERDQGICHICKKPVSMAELHFDHKIPLSKGGTHTAENVGVAHQFCNHSKWDKIL